MISATQKTQKILGTAAWAASILLLILSVKDNGIWIDEAQTFIIIKTSPRMFLNCVLFRGDAVSGMPLFFLLEFFWCRLFGFSEFAMRSINLLVIPLLMIGAGKLLRAKGLPQWMILFFAFNPVLLYYMNEARPYAALFTCGLWCFLFLFRGGENGMSRRDAALFFLCFWTGCAFHMMFVFMSVVYLGVLAWMRCKGTLRFREHFIVWAWYVPAFLVLAVHYLHFILSAPEVNAEKPQAMMSILQIIYYFSGLSGLGWSRNALRSLNLEMTLRIISGTSLFMLSALTLAVCCIRRKIVLNVRIVLPAVCILGSLIVFIAANIVLKTRFWERHIVYLLPGCILVVLMACYDLWSPPRAPVARTASCCFLALSILSGINIISLDYYQKDDYRGAVRIARSFHADHILFQGSSISFGYYGLKGCWAETEAKNGDGPLEGDVNITPATQEMMEILAPRLNGRSVLILSEREEFDKGGFYRRSSNMGGIRTETFLIFEVDSIAEDWLAKINK